MAGYLITLNNEEALKQVILDGAYSTILKSPAYNSWGAPQEGTFADYLSMKPGDLIFFFIKRKIYGCGKIISIGDDCKYWNYSDAYDPTGDRNDSYEKTHLLENGDSCNRCFCLFEPFPAFFKKGVDMDEVLQNKSNPFRSVRTIWKVSFIKLDDAESEALYSVLLKSNEKSIDNEEDVFPHAKDFHKKLQSIDMSKYVIRYTDVIKKCINDYSLKHEMALEASLCSILTSDNDTPFGKWDYISHQVAASPFKPIDYIDKMDIFGYKYIPKYNVISKYLIIELKKDCANKGIIEQIMKYVDWVANEYANGDYSMIEAFIVASDFDKDVIADAKTHCVRNFTKGFRPTEFCVWDRLHIVSYSVNDGKIEFSEL